MKVNQGLHGVILMNPWDDLRYPANGSIHKNKFYNISDYQQDVLTFQWLYAIDWTECNTTDSNCHKKNYIPRFTEIANRNYSAEDSAANGGPKDDFSMCDVWCQMPADQFAASEYNYDVHVNEAATNCSAKGSDTAAQENCMFFLTNGQWEPVIENVYVNEFRRLRMVNSLVCYVYTFVCFCCTLIYCVYVD